MVAGGEEREGRFDDLFEDLDKFFDPEEDEGEGGGRASGTRPAEAAARGRSQEGRPEGGAETSPAEPVGAVGPVEPPAGAPVADEEILPPGWHELGDLGLGEESADTGEHPPIEAWQPTGPEAAQPPSADVAAEVSGREDASQAESVGSRAEMTGQDWNRLRDVLAEEERDEEFDFLTEAPSLETEESLFGLESAGERGGTGEGGTEEPASITVEDLKKAPPVYRYLPRSDQGDEPAADEGHPPAGQEVAGEATEPAASGWSEPAIAQVEAAADQLAEEFGVSGAEDDLLADLHPPGPRTVKVEPEEMAGPSWEEPTSRPLRPEPLTAGGRNLPAAVITAAALVAAALISVAVARWAFAIVAGAVVLVGQAELYATMQRRGYQPATALGLVLGVFMLGAAYFKGEQAMLSILALGLMLSLLWYMAAAPKAREGALANTACTLFGLIYVPFLAGFVFLILTLDSGRALVLSVLGLAFLYDAAAFFVGSFWGSRVLAPTISPKKSWEGLIGATVVTFPVAVAILPSIHPIGTWQHALAMALVVSVFAPLGDLTESMIKRDLGVKDMGSILPGHGGILDRIDSVLFVAPAAFYLLRLIF